MVFAFASTAFSTPANKQAFLRHFGPSVKQSEVTCAVCHERAGAHDATTLKEFPHNVFGRRLRALGGELALGERLERVGAEDSDQDGISNLDEILAGGAPGDSNSRPAITAAELARRHDAHRAFRAAYQWRPFEPVNRPVVPVSASNWGSNPIDAFIAAEHDRRGLTPRPEARREILLRRVHLDLTGLSPTPEQQRAFLADASGGAYERVVAELLESPAYGERWGRHWMDIWRYSDWAGYKDALRESQRHIWHWRDWIVESLNADKPYDRMILEMLAGDEIAPEDPDTLRATGYLARQYFANRDQWMDDVVKHTAQAFMGVTMGCVKCHDHFYDPFPQQDYYAMRAIFEPYHVRTDRVPGELDVMKDGLPRAYDRAVNPKTYLFERGDERRPVKDRPIEPGVPRSLGGRYTVTPVSLPDLAHQPDRREFVKADLVARAVARVAQAKHELERAAAAGELAALQSVLVVEELEAAGKKDSPDWTALARETLKLQRQAARADARWKLAAGGMARDKAVKDAETAKQKKDSAGASRATRALATAKTAIATAQKSLAKAEKDMQAELTTKFTPRKQETFPATSNGRRLAFARWLTGTRNPLTARVAMNHLWARHFGVGIVPTVAEFGGNGREPTHPALLDWLAAEFMARRWSLKEMHRLIVTSATYRLDGVHDTANAEKDPDNNWLWRSPTRRMEGELVRDNLLHIAGTLDPAFAGPDIDNDLAETSKRRSIYLRHAHEKLVEFVQIFDGPKVSECYQREESIQPHQALALANSRLAHEQSRALAARLAREAGTDEDEFVQRAFRHILARAPVADELALCREFLARQPEAGAARENLIVILFNHNDFVTIR